MLLNLLIAVCIHDGGRGDTLATVRMRRCENNFVELDLLLPPFPRVWVQMQIARLTAQPPHQPLTTPLNC